MKQRITLTQFNRLNKKQKEKLIKWSRTCKSFMDEIQEGGYDPNYVLLNIGEMMEFLVYSEYYAIPAIIELNKPKYWCDCLWEACKEDLNET